MPLLLLGVIGKTKAAFAGCNGPPLWQPYFDVIKLLRKDSIFSNSTTWVFRAGPVVSLVTALLALSLVPLGGHPALISFAGDFVLFAYLLGLGRFFTIAAALDTGSAFEGMGSAREAAFSCLTEPALFLGLVVLVRISSSLSLSHMLGSYLNNAWHQYGASLVLVVVSLFIILLAENSRIPFDDPNTHLELTMIHEVMVLDHSGPALGFIQYGAALKLFVMAAIIVRLIIPFNTGIFSSWGIFIVSMIGLAIGIGVIESIMARLRLTQVPILLIAACLLSAFGIILMAR
ncbi:MAG: NADH-quinone oxidoreductase subunit H [Deltaproteobacteria bacterium]|nr:NADH-quinone oxidoreductase subunit H [Deltaproteobacteria bacterium]